MPSEIVSKSWRKPLVASTGTLSLSGYKQFRYPIQRYAAADLMTQSGCQKYHPRRRRTPEIRIC